MCVFTSICLASSIVTGIEKSFGINLLNRNLDE